MIGQTISRYKILEKLGEGGMGVVYKAEDTRLKRTVALKFLPRELTSDVDARARFVQEAQAASALNHPNICAIHTIEEIDGQQLLDMEFVEGETLGAILKRGTLSLEKTLEITIQAAEGLEAAHRKGIVHRDIKPENIMLTGEGVVKIMDFGLAKLRGASRMTKTRSTLGTLSYMSPEQARGEEVDQRSDIFSLGAVLYELITGHRPFRGEHEAAVLYALVNEDPEPLAKYRTGVPIELQQIVSKGLAKDIDKRYKNVSEMITELGNVRHELANIHTRAPRRAKVVWWVAAAMVTALVAVGIYLFYPISQPPGVVGKSVAVLPFENMSESKEDEYFSDGITDDIIAQLSKITDLKVISRTSVMQYKRVSKNVREIGKELDVATVLEGSVRHSGNQIRIVAQLIDAQNEGHLWADTYDKEMTQIFAIQSDVSQQIAAALQAKLSPEEKKRIERKQTENTEAYQLYLKGRFYWNKRMAGDLNTALEYFNQATEKDPLYALAYAGSASAYALFPQLGIPHPEDSFAKARIAAMKALQIDSMLAEAHAVLGLIAQEYDYDWAGAEQHYRRAINIDPSYPTGHQWYSHLLMYTGRFDEALSEIKKAQELDPLSLIINANLGGMLYIDRQYDRAIEQLKNTITFDTTSPWGHIYLSKVYDARGRFDDAVREGETGARLGSNLPLFLGRLGEAYAMDGRKKDALKVLNELLALDQKENAVSYGLATVYFALGDKDRTFKWLEKAYDMRDHSLPSLVADPLYDDLRSDPRCIALLKKMGLRK